MRKAWQTLLLVGGIVFLLTGLSHTMGRLAPRREDRETLIVWIKGMELDGLESVDRWEAQSRLRDVFPNLPDPYRQNLKIQMIKLRLARCSVVKIPQLRSLVETAFSKSVILPYERITADEIECDDPLPTTRLFKEQQAIVNSEPLLIYEKDQPLHPSLIDVERDEEWYNKMKHRFLWTREFLRLRISGLQPIEERRIMQDITLAIPCGFKDLRHIHLALSSLYVQTIFPQETVISITPYNAAADAPVMRAFVDLLSEHFTEIPSMKVVVLEERATSGYSRELAINVSKLPKFTLFDADDFMNPMWFEFHEEIWRRHPHLDAIMALHRSEGAFEEFCDLSSNIASIETFFRKRTNWNVTEMREPLTYSLYMDESQVYRSMKFYNSVWFHGNTDAETRNNGSPYLDFDFGYYGGGSQTVRRVVYDTLGMIRDAARGQDTKFEYRMAIAGFEVGHWGEVQGRLYIQRTGHSNCKEQDDLLTVSPADWVPPRGWMSFLFDW